jgi:hypothetical protein
MSSPNLKPNWRTENRELGMGNEFTEPEAKLAN